MGQAVQSGSSNIAAVLDLAARRLRAAGVESAVLDSQLLLAEAAGIDRAALLAGISNLSSASVASFERLIARREAREPMAYILGRREFYSLEFEVNPDVLIPRPETETLVDFALEFISERPSVRVLDLCSGPGTIAVALAVNAPRASIVAAEVSEAALEVARRNAGRHKKLNRIDLVRADLFTRLNGGPALGEFDLVVSNPPYIVDLQIASLEPDVRDFEPRLALQGGADGLDFFRRIAAGVKYHLGRDGLLALEVGDGQDDAVEEILADAGMRLAGVRKDLDGTVRVVTARP